MTPHTMMMDDLTQQLHLDVLNRSQESTEPCKTHRAGVKDMTSHSDELELAPRKRRATQYSTIHLQSLQLIQKVTMVNSIAGWQGIKKSQVHYHTSRLLQRFAKSMTSASSAPHLGQYSILQFLTYKYTNG